MIRCFNTCEAAILVKMCITCKRSYAYLKLTSLTPRNVNGKELEVVDTKNGSSLLCHKLFKNP